MQAAAAAATTDAVFVICKDGAEEVILEVRVDVGRERVHGTGNGAPH